MPSIPSSDPAPARYLWLVAGLGALFLAVFSWWGVARRDHFASIPLDGDTAWYRNYGDRVTREIQDRDILYHDIGHSIDEARRADIIFLGHSMLLWGLQHDVIDAFARRHGLRIYNLASAGDGSGEFLRLVVKRWDLHPRLWIINADDHAANFFNVSLDDFGASGKSSAISVVKYGRVRGFLNVVGRNLRWRLEDKILALAPEGWLKPLFPGPGLAVWRSATDGNWYLDRVPAFVQPNNADIKVTRSQDCHTDPGEVARARHYLDDIGGATVLMLAPYHEFCPQRVRELAAALDVEALIPPDAQYSSADGGGHLDKRGAIAFTGFLLGALEQTAAFKALAAAPSPNAP